MRTKRTVRTQIPLPPFPSPDEPVGEHTNGCRPLRGNGLGAIEICAQCGAADPGPLLHAGMVEGTVRLHRQCVRFWLKAHPQPKGRPIALVQITELPATGTLQ